MTMITYMGCAIRGEWVRSGIEQIGENDTFSEYYVFV